jgi:prepilin-type N-terminal cleavage/methylation domain-containing protein
MKQNFKKIKMFKRLWKVKKPSGFSLIELLVVIAIIGILVSLVSVSYNHARRKARDETREGNLQAIAQAIEMYYAQNKKYPVGSGTSGPTEIIGTDDLSEELKPFIGSVPLDPRSPTINYQYYYSTYGYPCTGWTAGTHFALVAHLEREDSSYTDLSGPCPTGEDTQKYFSTEGYHKDGSDFLYIISRR